MHCVDTLVLGLWGLVNNAALNIAFVPMDWQTEKDYQFINDVNLYGPIRMTMKFLPLLKKEKGRIVNTSECLRTLTSRRKTGSLGNLACSSARAVHSEDTAFNFVLLCFCKQAACQAE